MEGGEAELAYLRCPPPAGCRLRVRPLNLAGWQLWSLPSDVVTTPLPRPPPSHALRLEAMLDSPFSSDEALLSEVSFPLPSLSLRQRCLCSHSDRFCLQIQTHL